MRGYFTYISYRLIGALAGRLPPPIAYRLAGWVGFLAYLFYPRLRRNLSHNMRHVLGPAADRKRLQAVVRQACVNIIKSHYDLFRVPRLTPEEIQALTRMEGTEHLDRALARGRGVVIISPHFGNVDIVLQISQVHRMPLTTVVQHIRPERLFRYVLGLRTSHGLRMIPSDEPMLPLFRALKRGEMIGLACDRDVTDNAREVEFFGSPTRLPDGPVQVALRTGAALVPAYALRLPDNSFLVQIEPPLELSQTGDWETDVVAGMKQVVAFMERPIARHPEQWLVTMPIWPLNSRPAR